MPERNPEGSGLVLLLAPVGRDSVMMARVLNAAGIQSEVCEDVGSLCARLLEADTAVIGEETLDDATVAAITATLACQPRWSDFPLIVLGIPDSLSGDSVFERLSPVANLTLLERPTRPFTLVTVIRAALRSRGRQHLTREHLEELVSARAEAERVGRMKDEFLATLSHELRTPLNAISGWADLLKRGVLAPAEQAKAIETIARNSKAQRQLIEELLDMSRIIAGKVRLDLQPVDLPSLVRNAVESVRPAAEAKGVALNCDALDDKDAPSLLNADPARLQQVVWNLLTNAIKFTERGGSVAVHVDRWGKGARVRVTDTGAGIAPDFLPFVFARFRQADSSSRRSHGGLGLGLSIVKQLVEMHGGWVSVESPGERLGSTFVVFLPVNSPQPRWTTPPLGVPAANAQTPPLSATLQGVNILVVDDDDDGRDLIKRLLQDAGASVHCAATAADARRLLASVNIDVLLSDIAMPGEDGYDLIRWVRGDESTRIREVPAAAISAFARSEDRATALASGYHAHLSKPVDHDALLSMINGLRQRGRRRSLESAPTTSR